jgi:phosphoribosyl 1,2-cyclic phosphodiesterase
MSALNGRSGVEICVLASGSSGNCVYVEAGGTRILVDFGLSLRETEARLKGIGRSFSEIAAVLCTHDHTDHCRGLASAARRHPFRLVANEGTARAVEQTARAAKAALSAHPGRWDIFESGAAFSVGALTVESFGVPHDAADTVGYVLSDGRIRLGLCTDLGMATAVIRRRLADCDALILEFNHDVEMVRQSDRPWSLKQRILSRIGHLSNEDACDLLAELASERLQVVFPAHLSEACNTAALAERAARAALKRAGRPATRVVMTHHHQATEVVVV